MSSNFRKEFAGDDPFRAAFRQFLRNEDGVVTALACFIIIMMVLVGGIGVDLMRNEMERVRVQAVADRAVLAAADLDQTRDPEEVVKDYFMKSGMADYIGGVTVSEGINFRNVVVNTNTTTPTRFMRFMGVDKLPVPTRSGAEERIAKVEISLVLDVSGSMAYNDKLTNMKDAANDFIGTVLTPATRDRISVSLIPYSEQVNAGPEIMNALNVNQIYNYSHCIEFDNSDMSSAVLNRSKWYRQMQHFQWNYDGYNNALDDTICPRFSYEQIQPFSQSIDALNAVIDQYQPRAGTQIFLAMKWAVGMLDPDFQTVTNTLAVKGVVDGTFEDRPAAYDDADTLKTVVLMTDGQNSSSSRISSQYYDSNSDIVHWSNYNFNWYLSRYVSSRYRSGFYSQKYYASLGDQLLYNICDAAKAKNIVIWTIGFEVADHGAEVMQNCASTPNHFFRVEGIEIRDAFRSIARQITQLRLTQ